MKLSTSIDSQAKLLENLGQANQSIVLQFPRDRFILLVGNFTLEQLETDLVLRLDEIDTVFNYPDLAEDFLALLREWHEEATLQESCENFD